MLRRIFIWLALAASIYLTLCAGSLILLRYLDPPITAVQAQRWVEAKWNGRPYVRRQTFVPLEQVPPVLRRAVVAAEDNKFYEHGGVDWWELHRAIVEAVEEGERLRGASTITQQLLKNLFMTTHRSVIRKGAEYALAPAAEWILGKDRILELYLNVIEWGPGVWGAEAAARTHYGVPVSRIGREQAARLAACIPAPRRWKPEQMDEYSAVILGRMAERGW